MKLLYIINNKTKTSVPIQWSESLNKDFKNITVDILAVKKLLFKDIFKVITADIVHGHHVKGMFMYLILNNIFRKKTVYTVHGSFLYLSSSNRKLLQYIFRKTDKIVFVNKHLYDVLPIEYKSIIEDKYKIILNGVDLDFKYITIDVFNKYNIQKDGIIIFHPARFVKEKNHLTFLESFQLFVKQHPDAKLILAGDGVLKEEIIEKIKNYNLEKNVFLLGLIEKNDVYNFLEKCDLFIMPSISEGLNIAFLEAISMKRKVMVSNIEQFTYPFEHYHINPKEMNVYFANPKDVQEISEVLSKITTYSTNTNFNAEVFSLKNMFKQYLDIYKGLIE